MFETSVRFYDPNSKSWKDIKVIIDKKLNYDYLNCSWVAIDGEFTGLYPKRDRSALWSICSEENGEMRIEMLYTYNEDADLTGLRELIQSDKEKLFFYSKMDLAFLYQLTGVKVAAPIYDVKISSLLTRTHTQDHGLTSLVRTYISNTEKIIDKSIIANSDWVEDYHNWKSEIHQYNANDVLYLKYLSDKIKELSKLSNREEVVSAANLALPNIGVIYGSGFYRDIFKHGYSDSDMTE